MIYKGYAGEVEFDEVAGLFTGEVINTRDVITFQGKSVAELTRAFKESIDDYLDFCKSRNEEPDKPFSGSFLLRMPPEVHRQVALEARRNHKSLNQFILDRLRPGYGEIRNESSIKDWWQQARPKRFAVRAESSIVGLRDANEKPKLKVQPRHKGKELEPEPARR